MVMIMTLNWMNSCTNNIKEVNYLSSNDKDEIIDDVVNNFIQFYDEIGDIENENNNRHLQ